MSLLANLVREKTLTANTYFYPRRQGDLTPLKQQCLDPFKMVLAAPCHLKRWKECYAELHQTGIEYGKNGKRCSSIRLHRF